MSVFDEEFNAYLKEIESQQEAVNLTEIRRRAFLAGWHASQRQMTRLQSQIEMNLGKKQE